MNNPSIWEKDKKERKYKKLEQDITTDILIIGGGISGITTAYFLQDSSKKITLIDRGELMLGVTAKTTAKITYLQEIIYQTLESKFSNSIAKLYLDSQKEAIELILSIIKKHKISCDLKNVPSVIFTREKANTEKIKKEKKLLDDWNIKVEEIIDKNIESGIKVENTYVFHPIKYLDGLIDQIDKKVNIYEHTIAKNVRKENDQYKVDTDNGVITANQVIIATHYPFFLLPTLIPLKTYIKREYVNVGKNSFKENFSAITIDQKLLSLRFYKDYMIYGSNKNRLTSKIDYKKNYDQSRKDFYQYFNQKPLMTWMNQDIMSNDSLPFIGSIKPNLYILTAYNAWGMTNATIGAKLIKDLIEQKENKYQSLFNPNRMNFPLFLDSLLGSFHYMKVYPQAMWKKSNPYYIRIKGILYGIYIDENKKEHKIKMICPHMKCSLVFNREENTWDCPCHGSRFDLDGNIIEGPAIKKITEE